MAATKEELEKLKQKRSAAQTAFTKRANHLASRASALGEEELVGELRIFKKEHLKVRDAGFEYTTALREDDDEHVIQLAEQVDEKTAECDRKFDETEQIVLMNFWTRFAGKSITTIANEAESAMNQAEATDYRQMTKRQRELVNRNLEREIFELEKEVREWMSLIPSPRLAESKDCIRKLKKRREKLWDEWSWQSGGEEEESDDKVELNQAGERSKLEEAAPLGAQFSAEPLHPADIQPASNLQPNQPTGIPNLSYGTLPDAASTPNGTLNATQGGSGMNSGTYNVKPLISLERARLPTFSGDMRDYYRWKAEWEDLQRLGNPHGLENVRRFHLLGSLEDKVKREFVLSSCRSADDVFRLLDNKYGNKPKIVLLISKEVQQLPVVKGNHPRRTIELIQAVERALHDLQVLGEEDAVKNRIVAQSIESKLPDSLKEKWLTYKNDPLSGFSAQNHFDCLLQYLKKQEDILEELDQLQQQSSPTDKPERFREKKAFTRATSGNTQRNPQSNVCIVCGDDVHAGKLFACKVFKRLNLSSKKAHLKKTGVCFKCLRHHGEDESCSLKFLCSKDDCRRGGSSDHNYLLCPKPLIKKRDKTSGDQSDPKVEKRGLGLTDKQEELLAKLSPELKAEFKEAFSNKASTTVCTSTSNEPKEYPVIMMLLEATTNSGQLVGTLIDLASDTNYISNEAAKRLKLSGDNIKMIVYGVGGMERTVDTKRYTLRLRIKTPKGTVTEHKLLCYGLENIAKVNQAVKPQHLQRFFPNVAAKDLVRPDKIDLLISHKEGRLVPQPIKVEGDLVLWDGPLGKTVGGTHPDLFEEVDLAVHRSETHFARSMRTASRAYREILVNPAGPSEAQVENGGIITRSAATTNKEVLEWFRWDSVGAACDPKCGGCKCGRCPPGGKEMTLGDERDLEKIKECLTYVQEDKHCRTPHWDAAYPWKGDPATLPDNRRAVEATFLNTEKRLEREPEWKAAYREQIHEMVSRGAAAKLTKEEIDNWKGPKWYISHLIAPNPHSTTTPVRIVWNSSQEFRGMSLNDLLHKGPDVLNPIRGVLLRFRSGLHAALGDVKKMYNSIWLKDKEVHLHRFLWRDNPGDEIEVFVVVRVNIGDKPAGCIAQVAMRETANLPQFAAMVEERRVLVEDSYVDDILMSHNDIKALEKITKGVEEILKAGGFSLKPWVFSGQSGRSEATTKSSNSGTAPKTLVLPNQRQDEESKALGVSYEPETDKLRMMMSINFSKKRGKMRTGLDLREDEVRRNTPNPLTRRMLLSQIAAFYDPIGLATPAKQKGVMLVRESYQEAGKDNPTKDTWDYPLSPKLREASIRLFEEYVRLGYIRFERSITPLGAIGHPVGVTFSDGSEASYGAVLYLRWETQNGVIVRLVESKAKLTPLDQKGDVIKAELCGAVFATRLKKYFEKHCHIKVARWIHFVDSQTILGAIQKDSYGYQTFFANRIGEIQKAGPVEDWRWVEGNLNISDIITRGASPEELNEDSEWQRGPEFLKWPEVEWPAKMASEIVTTVADDVKRLKRKAFSAVVTRAQSLKTCGPGKSDADELRDSTGNGHPAQSPPQSLPSVIERPKRKLWGVSLVRLVDPKRFSTLSKLCGTIAWTRRAAESWLNKRQQTSGPVKWEAKSSRLSAEERATAFQDLAFAAQDGIEFCDTTLNRLVVFKDDNTGLLLCGGRVQPWSEDRTAVPLVPFQSWLGTLLAREAHDSNHEGVAATLLRTRRKAWVVQGRRIVKRVINECLTCKKQRAKLCRQVMSDLPQERTNRANPFEYTTLDLFGPFEVRDTVKKRVKKKVWGVVYCCMASRAVHADLVDDQSSESFLQAYSRFTALRGHPKKLWSDRGSNFVGARPALRELHKHLACLQKMSVENMAARNGTEWQWDFHPADAPHRNGAAEAAVKLIKRALNSLGGTTSCYTWGEFQTLLYSAANLTNDRPIDAKAQEQEDIVEYLTPNSLILGRTGQGGDMHGIDMETHPWRRLRAVQAGVDRFWSKWSELAGPNLFIRHKWHRAERNIKVGDVVWLADPNALRGQFRLGRVIATYPDKKGVVRDVDLTICLGLPVPLVARVQRKDADLPTTIVLRRDVRRLVVLIPVEDQ